MSAAVLRVLVNGAAGDCLSTRDRGLLYGDGLFETMAVRDGIPRHWSRHLERLQLGCARLGIAPPAAALLREEAAVLCRDAARAVLKILVTRGTGGRGYRPDPAAVPTRILQLHPYPDWPADYAQQGVCVRICSERLARNPRLAGIKHLNRLEQVLARAEWDDPAIAEGLMQDARGNIVEGTMSNILMLRDEVLSTPDLTHCGVAGVTRALILELAAQAGIPVRIRDIPLAELDTADEVMLCNSLIGIWPVTRIAERCYPAGRIAPYLQALLQAQPDES
ncbi:MAG: aminodeoxychorismate lyase [Pseudomonadota bacterium]